MAVRPEGSTNEENFRHRQIKTQLLKRAGFNILKDSGLKCYQKSKCHNLNEQQKQYRREKWKQAQGPIDLKPKNIENLSGFQMKLFSWFKLYSTEKIKEKSELCVMTNIPEEGLLSEINQ